MKLRLAENEKLIGNIREKYFGNSPKLKSKTILQAVSGDPTALMEIVDIYAPYIEKLSMRVILDENGGYKEAVDEEVRRTLETSLIAAVMKFDPMK